MLNEEFFLAISLKAAFNIYICQDCREVIYQFPNTLPYYRHRHIYIGYVFMNFKQPST
jgi:hypothetical protein